MANRQQGHKGSFSESQKPLPKFPLPKEVSKVVEARLKGAHPGLAFNKYVDIRDPKDKSQKKNFLKQFVDRYRNYPDKDFLKDFLSRQKTMRESLRKEGYKVEESKEFKSQWRMVSGLGMSHPFETGFVFDHTYGIPYLPGSSIKGAARAWADELVLEKEMNVETRDLIFGPKESGQQGSVIFFDAYPTVWPTLDLDIMNVHYKEYYEGKEPPADYLSPVPIYFLTVAAGQSFQFAVAVKPGVENGKDLADKAMKMVLGAAEMLGFGAKTAVGYGYFENGTGKSA